MKIKQMTALLLLCAMALLGCMGSAIGSSVEFADESLPEAMVGVYYHVRVKVVSDNTPYVVTMAGGGNIVPSGLAVTEDGVIYGTPKQEGVFPLSLQITYGDGETTFRDTFLVVNPFSEDALVKGGEDVHVIGEGNDTLTGIANNINGGRVTMEPNMDTVYFVSAKHKLYESKRPYTKAVERFSAPEYGWLDSIGTSLYYYQRYYQEPEQDSDIYLKENYVTRICRDPLGKKGRATLNDLGGKEITSLAVTDKIVLYIQGKEEGVLKRIPLGGGGAVSLRCYHEGKELQADRVFPYNGYAYLRNAENGCLYRVALDGEVAGKLTDEKVYAYTISRVNGEDYLFYAIKDGTLFRIPLAGGESEAFGGLKANAINSDADALYFANAKDKNRLYRVSLESPDALVKLTDFAVDQIYVFDSMLAVKKKGGQELYVLPKDGKEEPVRIEK